MSKHRKPGLSDIPLILVYVDPNDDYTIAVEHPMYNQCRIEVDLSPSPTWGTAAESNDKIADAVRKVLDMAWEAASGERVTRNA